MNWKTEEHRSSYKTDQILCTVRKIADSIGRKGLIMKIICYYVRKLNNTFFEVVILLNEQHFPNFVRGIRQQWFYFSKILKKFTICLLKDQLEDCLIITVSYLNRKHTKDLILRKFEGIMFYRIVYETKISKTKILPNSLETRQHQIRYYS